MENLPNPARLAIPAARIADCLLNPGEPYDFNGARSTYPDIRLVYWAGGNPFHHHQDLNRLRRAWQRPETIVVQEPWWTATARHGDIVLPATTTLERNDIGAAGRDRFVIAMRQAIDPVGAARNDFDIFRDLAARLGCEDMFTQGRDEFAWLNTFTSAGAMAPAPIARRCRTSMILAARAVSRYLYAADEYVLFADFRADPAGRKLRTPSGRIELYSDRIAGFGYDDCPPHPTWIEPAGNGSVNGGVPLHLVSSQPRLRLHSQMDCGPVSGAAR